MIVWLTALGHMIRDGFPALGSTHLARAAGGAVVFAGAWVFAPLPLAIILAAGVWLGFYTDALHGEANEGNWFAGIVSGCTSILPLTILLAAALSAWWLFVLPLGVLKPLIWQAAWAVEPLRWRVWVPEWAERIFEPTRVAAVAWGVLVGGVLCAVLFSR